MIIDKKIAPSAHELYAEAYRAHYSTLDLTLALRLYLEVVYTFPNAQESEWSRGQIKNIVRDVVPNDELMDAQFKLAAALLAKADQAAKE